MQTLKFTAPSSAPGKIFNIAHGASFAYIQNNDPANNMVVGFNDSLALDTGIIIAPTKTLPIPLDETTTELFTLAETSDITLGVLMIG